MKERKKTLIFLNDTQVDLTSEIKIAGRK